ncbi:MAG: 4-oxalomesaconate tautomerase [Kiloniellaceae bacterium]
MTASQVAIPCILMRGGTSKGPYFMAKDLPSDPATRDQVLLAAMGSPDARQIDGIGGATTLTSKVAIVSPSERPDVDVDYLFAQVEVEASRVDTNPPCGNIMAGVGPFALETGMVQPQGDVSRVRIYHVNIDAKIEAVVETPGGKVNYEGDTAIDGVPGTAAPVRLNFMDVAGSTCGSLLPTGKPIDVIDGIEVTCMDAAMPVMILAAGSVGKTGYETAAELDADKELFARIEKIRRQAGQMMGLGDVADKVTPKVILLAKPRHGGTISSRYFVPHKTHAAHAVTGGICLACCCLLEDGVAAPFVDLPKERPYPIRIEHPSGEIELLLDADPGKGGITLRSAGTLRTARKLMRGEVYVPAAAWPQQAAEAAE